MRKIVGLLAVVAAAASPAAAEPIYLECTLDDGTGAQMPWTISADEATGKFNFTHRNGTYEEKAIFTPTEIVVPDSGKTRYMTSVKRISRVDGTFKIETIIGDKPSVRMGKCKKADPPKRAF